MAGWYKTIEIVDTFLTGTMRREESDVKILLIVFLSEADRAGEIRAAWDYLAFKCGWEKEKDGGRERLGEALARLMAPDKDSSSPAEEGKRIILLGQNHYKLVNYGKYQEIIKRERKRAKDREGKAEQRAAEKEKPRPQKPKPRKPKPAPPPGGSDHDTALRAFIRVVESHDREPDAGDLKAYEMACAVAPPRDMVKCLQWAKTHKFWAGTLLRFKQLAGMSENDVPMVETIWAQYQAATKEPGGKSLADKKAELEAELRQLSPHAQASRAAVQAQIDQLTAKMASP